MNMTKRARILLFIPCLIALTYGLDRPATPTLSGSSFANGVISVTGSKTDGDSCHVLLLSDLSSSLGCAYGIGSYAIPLEGAAATFASVTLPTSVSLGHQSRERYFVAVASSKLNSEGQRAFSGWRVLTDTGGLPLPVTTYSDTLGETFFYRARRINERNTKQVVLDLSFSLLKRKAANYNLEIRRTATEIVDLNGLAAIPESKSDIREAMDGVTLKNGNTLILKRESGDFYLYNVYTFIPDFEPADTLSATIIDNNGAIHDTTSSRVGVFSDSSHQNIISTIYDLLRVGTTVDDPIYPGTLQDISASDTLKARLLITAMVDLSLPHNSPSPEPNEVSQGIFTNYIQFMDNVVRNWSTIRSGAIGVQRLQKIHEKVLEWNTGTILDPLAMHSKSVTLDFKSNNEKRKNYVLCNGFVRLDCELETSMSAIRQGAGLMVRISDNVRVYKAGSDQNNMFSSDELLLSGEDYTRLIIRDYITFNNAVQGNGIWLEGLNRNENKQFYMGIYPVRLPVMKTAGIIKIDTAFELTSETVGKYNGDIYGEVIFNSKNLFRIYPLLRNDEGTDEVINNVAEPNMFLHGQKRYIEVDSNYFKDASNENSAYFVMQGADSVRNKILVKQIGRFNAELQDTSPGEGTIVTYIMGKGLTRAVLFHNLEMWHLAFKDAKNGLLEKIATANEISEIRIAPPDEQLPDSWNDMGKVVLRRSDGMRVYSDASMTNEILFSNGEFEKEIFLLDFKSTTYFGNRNLVYLHSEHGGLDTLSVCFKVKGNEYFTETIRVIRVKPQQLFYLSSTGSAWREQKFDPNRPGDGNLLRLYIKMGTTNKIGAGGAALQYPSVETIRSNFDFLVSFGGGSNTVYPQELHKMMLVESGVGRNGATVEYDGRFVKISVDPSAELSGVLNDRTTYSFDIYNDAVQQYSNDADMFDRLSGYQMGKSRLGPNGEYAEFHPQHAISPISYQWGTTLQEFSFDYIYNSGQLYVTPLQRRKSDGVEEPVKEMTGGVETDRIMTYPRTAEWFFQSGHAVENGVAGVNLLVKSFTFSTDDKQYRKSVKEKLLEKWRDNVSVAIFNSCYNASVRLTTGGGGGCVYPADSDIWNDAGQGLNNNIFKWFEMLGNSGTSFKPNTAILGWGKSSIDGVAYGARDGKGYSPADKITHGGGTRVSFTEPMVEEWVRLVEREINPTGAVLANKWIEAAIWANEEHNNIIESDKLKIARSCHNAVAIGTDAVGNCKVFFIEATRSGGNYTFSIIEKTVTTRW